jgi:putative pyoverdin transport system ATP-binding/permease protein
VNLVHYLFRQSWAKLSFIVFAVVVAGLGNVGMLAIITKALTSTPPKGYYVWIFFGICILTIAFRGMAEISLLRLTQASTLQLRLDLSHKLLATPYQKLQKLGKSDLFVTLTHDIETCMHVFLIVPSFVCNCVVVIGCLVYLAWLSWAVFTLFVLVLGAGVLGFHYAKREPLRQMNKVRELVSVLFEQLRGLIDGSRELILNAGRGTMFVDKVIAATAEDFRHWFVRGMTRYSWIGNIGATLFYVLIGILALVLPIWLPQQSEVLIGATLVVLYIMRPVTEMLTSLPALQQASVSLEKIQRLDSDLASQPLHHVTQVQPSTSDSDLNLKLRGICHRYPNGPDGKQFGIGPIDMDVKSGEILFVIGGNGSGKTTLALLLLGLYEPDAGTIKLNDKEVTLDQISNYRQNFSAVFSDFHLFEHLIWTDDHAKHSQARRYLELVGMKDKVEIIQGNYSTLSLSAGQRKRLALVSSYLEDRRVYLFDEWAADQDPQFKRMFYLEMLPELKARGKAVIVITHDDAYFHVADRVVMLREGRLHNHPNGSFIEQAAHHD